MWWLLAPFLEDWRHHRQVWRVYRRTRRMPGNRLVYRRLQPLARPLIFPSINHIPWRVSRRMPGNRLVYRRLRPLALTRPPIFPSINYVPPTEEIALLAALAA